MLLEEVFLHFNQQYAWVRNGGVVLMFSETCLGIRQRVEHEAAVAVVTMWVAFPLFLSDVVVEGRSVVVVVRADNGLVLEKPHLGWVIFGNF